MATVVKIKISDISELRKQLDALFDISSQKEIAQWARKLAKHILERYAPAFENNKTVLEGFRVNEAWQQGSARMQDVRRAGFAVHRLAKSQDNKIVCTALRVVGQSVASGHMKEHGMVASDYAIKCCNLAFPDDGQVVERERIWQIRELQKACAIADRFKHEAERYETH